MITKFLAQRNFFFNGHIYRVTTYDTLARLYNLFRMGAVLVDSAGIVAAYDDDSQSDMKARVLSFIKKSTEVPRLDHLAGLKTKCLLGPKQFVWKLINLYNGGNLTRVVVEWLSIFNTTKNGAFVSDEWCVPDQIDEEFYSHHLRPIPIVN